MIETLGQKLMVHTRKRGYIAEVTYFLERCITNDALKFAPYLQNIGKTYWGRLFRAHLKATSIHDHGKLYRCLYLQEQLI